MATILEVRQALVARGFVPIPVEGKIQRSNQTKD